MHGFGFSVSHHQNLASFEFYILYLKINHLFEFKIKKNMFRYFFLFFFHFCCFSKAIEFKRCFFLLQNWLKCIFLPFATSVNFGWKAQPNSPIHKQVYANVRLCRRSFSSLLANAVAKSPDSLCLYFLFRLFFVHHIMFPKIYLYSSPSSFFHVCLHINHFGKRNNRTQKRRWRYCNMDSCFARCGQRLLFCCCFWWKNSFFFFFKYQMSSNICVCVSTKVYCFSMQLVANLFACELYTLSIENSSYLAWISPQLVLRPYLTHSLARLHSSTELHTQMYQFNYMQTYKIPIH